MIVSVAQTRPIKGKIQANIATHIYFIERAAALGAKFLIFPELSLTGYEPELAKELAISLEDGRLDEFHRWSDMNGITICLGAPTKSKTGIRISMIVFQPDQPRQIYSKQHLHSDEFPYFKEGDRQLILTVDHQKMAPAICYESLQAEHAEVANRMGAEVYVASVAKSQSGINKATAHYPEIAKKYAMPVLMSNCVGFCDNFLSVGQSGIWSKEGILVGQLDDKTEGLLFWDTETQEVQKQMM
jgi:predicted amidohydrolase